MSTTICLSSQFVNAALSANPAARYLDTSLRCLPGVRLSGTARESSSWRLSRKSRCSKSLAVRSEGAVASPVAEEETVTPAITLSEKALNHLTKMRSELSKDLLLRIGVRQGGCSGYSYVMDFEERSKITEGDSIIEHEGFAMVCDPKSLLFLYGMQLDFSDALIGGGFSFQNPNASSSCGCGKSFAA